MTHTCLQTLLTPGSLTLPQLGGLTCCELSVGGCLTFGQVGKEKHIPEAPAAMLSALVELL